MRCIGGSGAIPVQIGGRCPAGESLSKQPIANAPQPISELEFGRRTR
jgi:hypothetical protein